MTTERALFNVWMMDCNALTSDGDTVYYYGFEGNPFCLVLLKARNTPIFSFIPARLEDHIHGKAGHFQWILCLTWINIGLKNERSTETSLHRSSLLMRLTFDPVKLLSVKPACPKCSYCYQHWILISAGNKTYFQRYIFTHFPWILKCGVKSSR